MSHILIVSDDVGLKSRVKKHLLDNRHTLLFTRNSGEAMEMLMANAKRVITHPMMPDHTFTFTEHMRNYSREQQPIDLVISDQTVSGLSGYSFLEKVRERFRNMKTILINGDRLELTSGSAMLEIYQPDDRQWTTVLKIALQ